MANTDPAERGEFIDGLRELADYLVANPDVAVPDYPHIWIHIDGTDDQKRAEIERYAGLVDADPEFGIHYTTGRDFGSITYEFVAIPSAAKAEHRARRSYESNIDTTAANASDAAEVAA
jgi:hypothetical protein